MQWQDVIENPYLKNLPFKIELNRWGRIEMSPAGNRHALLQSRLARWVRAAMGNGETLTGVSVQTSDGVRVPGVVWASAAFLAKQDFETPFSRAPEICIEIIPPQFPPGNARKDLLYLEAGATEVWLVSETGQLEVEDADGARGDSPLLPGFREIWQRKQIPSSP